MLNLDSPRGGREGVRRQSDSSFADLALTTVSSIRCWGSGDHAGKHAKDLEGIRLEKDEDEDITMRFERRPQDFKKTTNGGDGDLQISAEAREGVSIRNSAIKKQKLRWVLPSLRELLEHFTVAAIHYVSTLQQWVPSCKHGFGF